jgi:hypothetical protein
MSDLLHWNGARIRWTPSGYKLHMTHGLQKREALIFEQSARKWLDNRLGAGSLWLEPMVRYEEKGGVRAELGQMEITGSALLDLNPGELVTTLEDLAARAEIAAQQAEADDAQRIGDFLSVLHAQG